MISNPKIFSVQQKQKKWTWENWIFQYFWRQENKRERGRESERKRENEREKEQESERGREGERNRGGKRERERELEAARENIGYSNTFGGECK